MNAVSIHDVWDKIKRAGSSKALILGLIIALVASASFALGRISAYQDQKVPLQIVDPETSSAPQ